MLANDRIASHIYDAARERLGPRARQADGQAILRQRKDALRREYVGYEDTGFVQTRANLQTAIAELERAAKDDLGTVHSAGQPLRTYLAGRQAAMTRAQAEGYAGFGRAAAMAPVREMLRLLGEKLADEHPAFRAMWEQVFSRELPDDVTSEA
jgi:hypothetical protein